ncbi:signal peptidase I [Nocardioides currus]|uniref:Signal peptidase I n=1 Tax=Nocardioides currus TaxID=2133958 RepID=A0A2R7YWT6_9ACTN|nr:signal peptidase I [Nocardioides currus]PUA80845.1 signal peptidase I [Nocardioides currus]
MQESPHRSAGPLPWARLVVVLLSRTYRAMLVTLVIVAALPPLVSAWGAYVVESGSMRPGIHEGHVVLASPTGPEHRVHVGRVYVFDDPAVEDRVLVHRIVERRDDGDFTTAGDANELTDSTPLDPSGIRAQALLLVPYVGLPLHWLHAGRWPLVLLWTLLTAAAFLASLRRLDGEPPTRRPGLPRRLRPDRVGIPRRRAPVAALAVAVGAVVIGAVVVGGSLTTSADARFTSRTATASGWTAGTGLLQPYVAAVLADQPYGLWLLDEAAGTAYAADRSGNNRTGELFNPLTPGRAGGLPRNPGTAVGTNGGRIVLGTGAVAAPAAYSIELWFRTTSTSQGYLAGFENDRDANYSLFTTDADRAITMEANGRITFGRWPWSSQTITSTRAYNDGAWHHLVVTSTAARATTVYVDGAAVVAGTTSAVASYTGYWRVGQGSIGLLNTPGFVGDVDNVSIYHSVLPAARVAAHWAAR